MKTDPPANASLVEIVRELGATLEALRQDVQPLPAEMRAAREQADRDREEFNRGRAWARLAMVVAFLVLAGGLTTSLVVNRSNQDVIESIKDCTQAGGRCYAESQERTRQNVDDIVQAICMVSPPEKRRTPPCPAEPDTTTQEAP